MKKGFFKEKLTGLFRSNELRIAYRELRLINALEANFVSLTDKKLKSKTAEFKNKLKLGASLEDIRVEAYAVVREAAKRVLKKRPYDVQIIAGIILDLGAVAEMKTGEGKTITSLFPVYLNALTGKGVVVSTVNEYLVQRDAIEMGEVFNWLGLSVGINLASKNANDKRIAYGCDITYSTHSEFGFDYLRDNMVTNIKDKVQRGLNFVIIDEADSILIDEAKTPLIISGGKEESLNLYLGANNFASQLVSEDYLIDEESRAVRLTEVGIDKANKFFNLKNLYEIANSELVHRVHNAMRAHLILKKDFEYIVSDNKILLVDGFTGRIMEGRAFSEGLQQALQAKEGVDIEPETRVLATTTYQNFFRLFKKLAGMTGTAKTEEREFIDIYNMRVIPIPTNLPMVRIDEEDVIYLTLAAKYKAIVKKTKELFKKGQPVLIGTGQVETSEILHQLLTEANVPHKVLNAKQNAQEAEIIARAGKVGAVTIATNMAGRGTDIKPTREALNLGGLYILGTERAESRRIDNQLKGRSGRQGDIGISKLFLSLEDTLIIRFASHQRLKQLFIDSQDQEIEDKFLKKIFIKAQKRIEGFNYDQRKSVLSYDDVIRQQRDLIYEQRDLILQSKNLIYIIKKLVASYVNYVLTKVFFMSKEIFVEPSTIIEYLNHNLLSSKQEKFNLDNFLTSNFEDISEQIIEKIIDLYLKFRDQKRDNFGEEAVNDFERKIILKALDIKWQEHISNMDRLRQSSHVFQYAQKNPYQVFTERGGERFLQMIEGIAKDAIENLFNSIQTQKDDSFKEEFRTIKIANFFIEIGSWGTVAFDEKTPVKHREIIFSILQKNQELVLEEKWEELEFIANAEYAKNG